MPNLGGEEQIWRLLLPVTVCCVCCRWAEMHRNVIMEAMVEMLHWKFRNLGCSTGTAITFESKHVSKWIFFHRAAQKNRLVYRPHGATADAEHLVGTGKREDEGGEVFDSSPKNSQPWDLRHLGKFINGSSCLDFLICRPFGWLASLMPKASSQACVRRQGSVLLPGCHGVSSRPFGGLLDVLIWRMTNTINIWGMTRTGNQYQGSWAPLSRLGHFMFCMVELGSFWCVFFFCRRCYYITYLPTGPCICIKVIQTVFGGLKSQTCDRSVKGFVVKNWWN